MTSPEIERWTAKRTLDQHREAYPGGTVYAPETANNRCAQCQPAGCPMLEWARRVLTGNAPRF